MSLCKLETVKAARKDQGKCERCGVAIEVGAGYRHWQGRFGPKHVRCLSITCTPRPWERETNVTKSEAMQGEYWCTEAQNAGDPSTVAGYLKDALASAEALVDDLAERIANKEGTPLESSSEFEALSTSHDAFEEWVSEAEDIAGELEELGELPEGEDEEDDEGQPTDAAIAFEEAVSTFEELQSRIPDWPELDLGSYGPPRPQRKASAG